MQNTITFEALKGAPIAHTDAGDFVFLGGQPCSEVYVLGTISKARAGILFLEIEGRKFSAHKQKGFSVDEEVICICEPIITEGKVEDLRIRSLEKK
jgi:hypothetical protein